MKVLDTGDILAQEEVEIPLDMDFGQLYDLLAKVGADLLIKTIPLWQAGELSPQPQAEMEASYAALLKKDDEKIDWTNPVGDESIIKLGIVAKTRSIYSI